MIGTPGSTTAKAAAPGLVRRGDRRGDDRRAGGQGRTKPARACRRHGPEPRPIPRARAIRDRVGTGRDAWAGGTTARSSKDGKRPKGGEASLESIVDLDGLRIRCVDEGSGPAVVFLHGLAADLETFAAQAEHLRGRYRCIRPDMRGHGGSANPPGPWAIADLAEDVARLLARLGVDRAHFVGHSAGGVVASRLVLDRPDLVRSLCLVATAPECNEKAATEFYLRWAGIAESDGMAAALTAMGARRLPDESKMGDPLGFARGCRAIATLFPEPLTPKLAAVRVPALVVVGEKDWIGVGGSVRAHRALAGSELVILPGLGHQPFTQDPAGFNARLDAFLASAEAADPAGGKA